MLVRPILCVAIKNGMAKFGEKNKVIFLNGTEFAVKTQ